jgi:diaminopimelate decarboxylase
MVLRGISNRNISARIKSGVKTALLRCALGYDFRKRDHDAPQNDSISPETWGMSVGTNGHLFVQSCDTVQLATRYGTPLHVIDKEKLASNYYEFFRGFRTNYSKVEVAYSYKTNPLPGVLKVLHEFGASAEVISPFELWLAFKLGVIPDKIIYNGPGKSEESLEMAIRHNIKLINVDGPSEIEIIGRLSRLFAHEQQVGVRVITSVGWSGQFGFDIGSGAAVEAFRQMQKFKRVVPCGLHFHLGTGLKNVGTYLQAIAQLLDFAAHLRSNLGIEIKYFDIGGGFGVPTVRPYTLIETALRSNGYTPQGRYDSPSPTVDNYSSAITELFRKRLRRPEQQQPLLILEPGRAITSSAQTLLLRVLATKTRKDGKTIAILDGGKNIALNTGWEHHHFFPASRMHAPFNQTCGLYGPLCHPDDCLYTTLEFPAVQPNDIIAIMDAGAYFISNQMNFSFPRPSAVLVEKGQHQLIRGRESFQDLVRLDVFNHEQDTFGI